MQKKHWIYNMMKTFQMIEIIPIITCTLNVSKHIEKSTPYKALYQDIEIIFLYL